MNLYKHIFKHWSQNDSEEGIKKYFLAENDREAFDIVYGNFGCRTLDRFYDCEDEEYEDEDETDSFYIDDVEYECGTIDKEKVIEIISSKRGELNFKDLDSLDCWDELYYGLTLEGWELVAEHVKTSEQLVLNDLGITKEKD